MDRRPVSERARGEQQPQSLRPLWIALSIVIALGLLGPLCYLTAGFGLL